MFFIKKIPVPRWEAIPDPWASSRACIRCSMAALSDPGVEDVVIHSSGSTRVTSRRGTNCAPARAGCSGWYTWAARYL